MNILVVRTDKLGDFITALPAIYLLKAYDSQHKITVCVAPLNEALAKSLDFIDEVIVDRQDESIFSLVKKLKSAKIDIAFTLFSNTRIALAQLLAAIHIRVAPATKIAQIFYTNRVKQRRSQVKMSEFEYNIALCRSVFPDLGSEYPQPLLNFIDAQSYYEAFCRENEIYKEIIAFHVGFGGSSDANWTLEEYVVLIKELSYANRYQVVLTFGPDEEELCKDMQSRLINVDVRFYISQDGLVNFAKLISQFTLFVSTSTGTYHLASLVGTRTMTFFADSLFASAARWKGIGDEKLQTHFMLPQEPNKREEMFERVKLQLKSY
ncbi:MAG: glycosyltransferase family 9 protein [Campylobacterales bacterium]|nr:glycosyltransferase family 9 protein [Campylobacterales bacterium]